MRKQDTLTLLGLALFAMSLVVDSMSTGAYDIADITGTAMTATAIFIFVYVIAEYHDEKQS